MSELKLPAWYVVRTKQHAAERVAIELSNAKIKTYLPRERRRVIKARRTIIVVQPLLQRYLFADIYDEAQMHTVRYTRGVDDFLRNEAGHPQAADDIGVAQLHLFEELGEFDYTPVQEQVFVRRQQVRIATPANDDGLTAGEFEGRTASYLKERGKQNVEVLLDAVVKGGMRCVTVLDRRLLEAA